MCQCSVLSSVNAVNYTATQTVDAVNYIVTQTLCGEHSSCGCAGKGTVQRQLSKVGTLFNTITIDALKRIKSL